MVWWIFGLLAAAVMLLALTEWLVRRMGLAQFPLYAPDLASNYRMAANQRGTMRNTRSWCYDRHGMRRSETPENFAGAVLLVGDSIVDCSVHLDQRETLGASLERKLGRPVYPVAAPGWSLGNELAALAALPGWDAADDIVLVLNAGDFDYDAEASTPFGFPMARPRLVSLWLAQRFVVLRNRARLARIEGTANLPADPALRARNLDRLRELAGQTAARWHLVRHPERGDAGAFDGYFGELARAAGGCLLDGGEAPDWSASCYRDAIHLSAHGAGLLADYLAGRLKRP